MKENDNEIAIKVDHVYKSFNIYYDRANTLKERMLFFARNKRREKREVLKDINLEIKKGETVALIGVNGSLEVKRYQKKDGSNGTSMSVAVREIEFCNTKKGDEEIELPDNDIIDDSDISEAELPF